MLSHVLRVLELIDSPTIDGPSVVNFLRKFADSDAVITTRTVEGDKGSTDFVSVTVPGSSGRTAGGDAPTIGVIGRLGGIGARPERLGYVSDGDGATTALSVAAKLLSMRSAGEVLPGDVICTTHVCPTAPTRPHEPVPFMDSPVDIGAMNENEVDPQMDAIISVDTTKGNRLVNHRGIAVSPTVCQGYILRTSEDLLSTVETVTGRPPVVLPLSTQDITPYGNGLYHLNSILQPATATTAPVVGVAITTETMVAGSATGASHEVDIALAARFSVEVAKAFTSRTLQLHDEAELQRLTQLYGSARHLQTAGATSGILSNEHV